MELKDKLKLLNRMSDLSSDEIERLTNRIRKGDRDAFSNLFLKLYEPLTKFAWRYLRSKHIAEEVVQDVFMDIWEGRDRLDPQKNVRSYLYQSVKNKALNQLKHKKIAEEHNMKIEWLNSSPEFQEHQLDEGSKFVKAARKSIEELPEGARQIYKLSRKDGLTYKEIAEVLEISPKTVESQMSRALKILRRDLAKFLPAVVGYFMEVI